MAQQNDDLPEFEELEALEPIDDPPPAGAQEGGGPPGSRRARAGAGTPGEKRQLERAPLLLRKASKILILGALFPFFSALREGFDGWVPLYVGKALAGLACWLLYQGFMATHGGQPVEAIKNLAARHRFVVPILSGVVAILSLVPAFGTEWLGSISGEVATLILGGGTLVHIWSYEHGGKFNPIFPLMFLGPGIAGLLNVFGAMGMFHTSPVMAGLGLVGSVVVAAGGLYAMLVMYQSIRQAKVEGDLKREQLRLQRKAEREAQKAKRPPRPAGPGRPEQDE